jgi:hypothetical protein
LSSLGENGFFGIPLISDFEFRISEWEDRKGPSDGRRRAEEFRLIAAWR